MGFWGSFTGSSQRKDLSNAYAQSTQQVNQGFDRAEGAVGNARTAAQGYYQPYAEGGTKYNALLQDALGVNGAEGGQRAQTAYQSASNPYLQYQQDQAENALMKGYNARGQTNSGTASLAAARSRMDLGMQDYNNWRGMIGQQQGQGLQVAGQQAGIEQGYGQQMSDLATGRAGTLAGNTINFGNAQAASRGIGINNLLGIAGLGAKAFAGGGFK
ncbi:MAG: hypothetical protein ACOYLK_14695 [Sphingomonas sp.]